MTLIIGHRNGWMVSDRRQLWGHTGLGPFAEPKITRWRFGEARALVGLSGATDFIEARLEPGDFERDPLDVLPRLMRDAPDDNYDALVLREGKLGVISGHGVYHHVNADCAHWAIGSGKELGLGYLAGVSRFVLVAPDHALQAIEFASKFDTSVGDGVQVEMLR